MTALQTIQTTTGARVPAGTEQPESRPALSLRLSVTARCQLRCLYCVPPGADGRPPTTVLSITEILRFVRAVRAAFSLTKIHITGGEPLIRADILDLIERLADEGIEGLALTSNGQRLAPMARDLKRAGLRRVNVSLDSIQQSTYRRITRGGDLHGVLRGLEAARECGLDPVKLNTVVLKGINEAETVDIARFALDAGCQARFLELMPIGCARSMFDRLFVSAREVRSRLATVFTFVPLPYEAGASSRNFLVQDAKGRAGVVGFIASETAPFCRGCSRLRLTSDGRLLWCLASGRGASVKALLRGSGAGAEEALARTVREGMAAKCARGAFDNAEGMVAVGG